ncbi:TlpA family protein disulfide reductase [Parabacteroides sp. FAFU027]|uniref:TlpA family protein disulfide reductase n=1 Tax=Parabacteroides sp. FAFU027 TaxID=2922715 RepID=UPI001FB035A8|nr:TlpA disulfide reductase family protein [Parabacteroides sp. FAFU027]
MKKHILLILLLALFGQAGIAQTRVIKSPKVEAATHTNVIIDRIALSDTATVLDFTVSNHPGQWIIFAKKNYLINSDGGNKIYCRYAIGYNGQLGDKWYMPESGKVHFSLVYPPIDKKLSKIDFIEGDNIDGAFKIFGVEINPSKRKAILPEALEGNWLKTDGSNDWTLGVYDKLAIYKNDFWQYQSVTKQGKSTTLTLKKGKRVVTLTLLPVSDDKLMIAEGKSPMQTYSRKKTFRADYNSRGEQAFTSLPFGRKETILRGYLKGYSPKLGFKTDLIYVQNDLTREDFPALLTFQPDGHFEAKFDLIQPTMLTFRIGNELCTVYMEPGDKTMLYLSLGTNKEESPRQFMGSHALENNDLYAMGNIGERNYMTYQKEKELSPVAFKANRLKERQADINDLNVYLQQKQLTPLQYNQLSPKALQIKRLHIDTKCYGSILDYLMNLEYKAKDDSTKQVLRDISYYDFLKDLFANQSLLPVTYDFSSLINRLEYSPVITPADFVGMELEHKELAGIMKWKVIDKNYVAGVDSFPALLSVLEKMNITPTPAEHELFASVGTFGQDTSKWNSFIKAKEIFSSRHRTLINILNKIHTCDIQKAILRQKLGVEPGLIYEIIMLRAMCTEFKTQPFSPSQLDLLKPLFKTPFLQSELVRFNNEKIALQNEKTLQPKAPTTSGESILHKLIDKYKGDVLAIDFWSTGCGPCRSGMTERKDMPDEYKDKKVKFIYITDEEASPLEPYNNFIKDIKGEHLRITRDEWNQLAVQYKINGIPHFMIVNKNGAVIENNTQHYWGTGLKNRLDNLVTE